ncbi:hypothetical protein [Mycobacterium intracellulare]|uniref:Uncharacterized protein n=1 Tax=Mycobacterium intracellulare subsp. chimaera TaxID=222805 RepID=A0ABT7P2E1_MYCIT|nr:hypothetical protein [Mycobacterium intracellulare]MDM3927432.1 hypothetical protein [Mycobacterium intracellulare subsp. chimaera]
METTDAVHVSLVHARFAADLLVGVREELLRLTTDLDVYMDRARRAGVGTKLDAAWLAIAASAPGNRRELIAAAAYAQWLSDHIRLQSARWKRADKASATGYAKHSEESALLERQPVPFEIVEPPKDPPPHPGALDSTIAMLPAPYLAHIDRAREWCGQALWAARMSNTQGMAVVCGYMERLLGWMEENP